MSGKVIKPDYFKMVERVRSSFAEMINASSADEVALTKNTSDGINMIASSFPWKDGDNVVVCDDLEHPNNIYPWLNQKNRSGIEVRSVPSVEGAYDVDKIIDAIDQNTRIVTVCSVTFAPGFRTDLKPIGVACRERGAIFLVDGAQSVGILDLDVQELNVDALALATQKGLLGLYGQGFLYFRREWAEKMALSGLARFGVDLGEGVHEAGRGSHEYDLMPGARRFDLGNYNVPALAVAEISLNLLLSVGVKRIEQHVPRLNKKLAAGFKELGIPTTVPAHEINLSHTLSVGTLNPHVHDKCGDEEMESLSQYLQKNKIAFSLRRGMLRFTLHVYNDDQDIDHILRCASEWRAGA